jgi:methyl-accepting chemotaxis protein
MIQSSYRGLRGRIVLGGLFSIVLIGAMWLVSGAYFLNRYEHSITSGRNIKNVHIQMEQMVDMEQNTLMYDIDDPHFFQTGQSRWLQQREEARKDLEKDLAAFDVSADKINIDGSDKFIEVLEKHDKVFAKLVATLRERGFRDWGAAGRMNKSMDAITAIIGRSGNLSLQNRLLQLQRDERGYLLRGDEDARSKAKASLTALRAMAATTPQAAALSSVFESYSESFNRYLQLEQQIGAADTDSEGLISEQYASVASLEPVLFNLEKQAVKEGELTRMSLNRANAVILLVGICIGGFIFTLFAKSLREAASTLSSSASEILASTTQVAAGASETAAAVTQTTATVEEVKQTAQLSSQKAREVADSALHSAEVSFMGNQSVMESIAGMERVREQMASIAESVINLSEQSQAIGDIINTVNDLAEQSNLLAVNAAIEAAKAGEQGKGFGVVAQEVKSLAEQSKQATRQVRTILNEIQKATGAAVMSTEQGTKAVEAGLSQAEEAGRSIQNLSSSIEDAAQAALQIAASSQEQLVGVDQVALAMNSIKDASTQNVTSMRQLEIAARDLTTVGQSLRKLV